MSTGNVNRYDPEVAPNSEEWLELDEQERFSQIEQYHQHARIKLPNLTAHAIFHAIIENQIAEKLEPVVRAMARLSNDNLSRHDAVHAIANVAAEHVHDLFKNSDDAQNSLARYNAAVERITAKNWLGG
jgi:hypothetical protein